MKSLITVLAILISVGSVVPVRAQVTNVSTQQRTTVVGNNVTTIDSKTTTVNNGKISTKPRSSGGLKLRTR